MALEYFAAYHSYLKSIEPLNDAERGRLFTACLQYSMTGIEPELHGNERFIFPTIQSQIDRDREKYDRKCEKNRENGTRGGQANAAERKQSEANAPQTPPKEKEKEKEKEKTKEKAKEKENVSQSLPPASSPYPPTDGSSCAEAGAAASTPAVKAPLKEPKEPASPTVITLTLNDHSEHAVTQADVDGWQELFPGVDVMQQLRAMKAWCKENPAQRKTKSGVGRFIVSWLTREQNRGGSAKSSPPARSRGYQTAEEYNATHGGTQRDDAELARRILDRSRDDADRLRRQLDAQKKEET